jgi:hypothetical protein
MPASPKHKGDTCDYANTILIQAVVMKTTMVPLRSEASTQKV